jgi:succinoglycan biosynthesis protein ExoM
MKVSVCIATHRRMDRLAAVLDDLVRQERLPDEVVVVDNDASGSARTVVEQRLAAGAPFPLHYEVQPERNIALTRNRTVALATGEWLAFIDDDERAPPAWLGQLLDFALKNGADGVLGPVIPVVPPTAPAWIRKGAFYDFPRLPTGAVVPLNRMRFGNLILRSEPLRREPGPFDPGYGLMNGEDGDLLVRMAQHGAKVVWCDDAVVHEPIEPARLSLTWILRRSFSGGQDFAQKTLAGSYGPLSALGRMRFLARTLAQLLAALALAAGSFPFGQHHAAHWLTKASANYGKLTVAFGRQRYRAYA